jgi:cobalt-zinc-cadmium efflux system membrane fusion protein
MMKADQQRLLGAVAAAVLLAGAGGFGLAQCTHKPVPTPAGAAKSAETSTKSTLEMTAAAISDAGVVVQSVMAGGLQTEILSQGTVVAAPGGEAVLTARASGTVTRLFKRLGDSVRRGETLAIVESRDAAQIAAERVSAEAKATLARRTLAREKSLYDQRVSPRVDYERAEAEAAAANADARRAQISAGTANVTADGRGVMVTSPITGRVTAVQASLGAFVQPENELFRVADPRLIQIDAAVGGQDAARVAVGDRAVVEGPDGQAIEARVRAMTPSLSTETRAATAVLEVSSAALQPGQAVRARIFPRNAGPANGVVVPEEAAQSIGGQDVVFVRTDKGFQIRPITLGRRSAGRVEVVAGLAPGQSVAMKNAFLLKAELGKSAGEED